MEWCTQCDIKAGTVWKERSKIKKKLSHAAWNHKVNKGIHCSVLFNEKKQQQNHKAFLIHLILIDGFSQKNSCDECFISRKPKIKINLSCFVRDIC